MSEPPATAQPAVFDPTRLDLEARFGAYSVRDAAWAQHQPVLVGRDFDFEMAVMLEGTGAGVAAAKRQRENGALANLIGREPALTQDVLLAMLLEHCQGRCPRLSGQRVLIYGLLYGDQKARLRTVVELDSGSSRVAYAALGGLGVAGDLGQGQRLHSEFEHGLDIIADWLSEAESSPPASPTEPAQAARCATGDADHAKGRVLAVTDNHAKLKLTQVAFPAYLHCPLDAFATEDGPPAH